MKREIHKIPSIQTWPDSWDPLSFPFVTDTSSFRFDSGLGEAVRPPQTNHEPFTSVPSQRLGSDRIGRRSRPFQIRKRFEEVTAPVASAFRDPLRLADRPAKTFSLLERDFRFYERLGIRDRSPERRYTRRSGSRPFCLEPKIRELDRVLDRGQFRSRALDTAIEAKLERSLRPTEKCVTE
jgi:hypothetical protein